MTHPSVWNHEKDFPAWPAKPRPEVSKIVLGKLNAKDDDRQSCALPENFADLFPNLTHLYLWSLRDLKKLPKLPENLRVLDVRGCADLEEITHLPSGLETLDVAKCAGLTKFPTVALENLRRLHIDDCTKLPQKLINRFVDDAKSLEEFTAQNCIQLTTLDLPEQADPHPQVDPNRPGDRQLQKLVLSGCAGLVSLPELASYKRLRHVDITNCERLAQLPRVHVSAQETDDNTSEGLRYLLTTGCPALRSYGEMDVRTVTTGEKEKPQENVAPTFRTMERLHGRAAELIMAKLLLLGSGRCGKTTISKALQWYDLPETERARHPELNPLGKQESTQRIQFWPWMTEFEFSNHQTTRKGMAHLWDFAGQEVYHNTHRLFASQGSLFIIATTDPDQHAQRLNDEIADPNRKIAHPSLYRDENEYRELKYWLDYLRNALRLSMDDLKSKKVSILIVHTGVGTPAQVDAYLKQQAGPYRNLLATGDLPVMLLDMKESRAPEYFQKIATWVKRSLGVAADNYGVRVPELFCKVAVRCEEILKLDLAKKSVPRLDFPGWQQLVCECLGPAGRDLPARQAKEYAEVTARHLHNCGRIFWLGKEHQGGEIIINQQWSTEAIYAFCNPAHPSSLSEHSQRFFSEDLLVEHLRRDCPTFQYQTPLRQSLLPELLHQCNICVRAGGHKWMAVQRELLPRLNSAFQNELIRSWEEVANLKPGHYANHSCAIRGNEDILLGNSDYRELLSWLAREGESGLPIGIFDQECDFMDKTFPGGNTVGWDRFGSKFEIEGWFWQNGFQLRLKRNGANFRLHKREEGELSVIDEHSSETVTVLLRVEWVHARGGARNRPQFDGGLYIQFLTPDEATYAPRLMKLLFEENGPLAFFDGKQTISDQRTSDLDTNLWGLRDHGGPLWARNVNAPPPAGVPYEVAISYRSEDRDMVVKMAEFLKRAQLSVYSYEVDLELYPEYGGSSIMAIYDYLKYAKVLILVPSTAYFEEPKLDIQDTTGKNNRNLYCPVEMAEAILAWKGYSLEEQRDHGVGANRPDTHLLWVAEKKTAMSTAIIETRATEVLRQYYDKVVAVRAAAQPHALNDNSSSIVMREREALSKCQARDQQDFFTALGRAQKNYLRIVDKDGPQPFVEVLERIQQALAAK